MKKQDNEKLDRIEKALQFAYQSQEDIQIKDGWQNNVMREIRKLHSPEAEPGVFRIFGKIAWRLIPVTCLLIVMVCAGLLVTDFSPEYEVASMYINSPFNYDILMGFDLM